jgi:spore coat polysaccharide biosynthesis protein SpsF
MLSLCGKPLLFRIYERVKRSNYAGDVVIITSRNSSDDPLADFCAENNLPFFRGHPTDLLDRHYKAAKKYKADVVVKIPSDCPLIDPAVIDKVIKYYLENFGRYDYVSNLHPATYPDGNDVEVMSVEAIEIAWKEAGKDFEREHTTPYLWEHPEQFRISNVEWSVGLDYSSTHRWTIDYEEDYVFIRSVYEELFTKKPWFGINDILDLLKEKPYLGFINNKYLGRYWYEKHLDSLKNIEQFKRKLRSVSNA